MNDQRSTTEQLRVLARLGDEHGLNDAADFCRRGVELVEGRMRGKVLVTDHDQIQALATLRGELDRRIAAAAREYQQRAELEDLAGRLNAAVTDAAGGGGVSDTVWLARVDSWEENHLSAHATESGAQRKLVDLIDRDAWAAFAKSVETSEGQHAPDISEASPEDVLVFYYGLAEDIDGGKRWGVGMDIYCEVRRMEVEA